MNDTPIFLILNAGSSSLKFAVFAATVLPTSRSLLCEGQMSGIGHTVHFKAVDEGNRTLVDSDLVEGMTHEQAIDALLDWLAARYAGHELVAAGHRVVHGGAQYHSPVLITPAVLQDLRELIPLAPLHQPHHVAAIESLQKRYPSLPQVASFDTAFHHTNSALSTRYALPRALTAAGVRRYGFHGLSYEYIASVMESALGPKQASGKVVVAHLGAGASMCALHGGLSVASTMGFTPLDGLPMSQRCGAIDPGVLLYLLQQRKMSPDQLAHLLYSESGLLGVSGISDDMKTLLECGREEAQEAVDLFVYRFNRELGSLVAALGGLDALIFTAGIGEHSALIRESLARSAAWLGLELDPVANQAGQLCISSAQSSVSAWVMPTNEDLMIALHTFRVLQQGEHSEQSGYPARH